MAAFIFTMLSMKILGNNNGVKNFLCAAHPLLANFSTERLEMKHLKANNEFNSEVLTGGVRARVAV
jgi:hypothetical protein